MGAEVTKLLKAVRDGDRGASERLLQEVHAELRRMADVRMRGERSGHTLQPTALVHEAWLRLVGSEGRLEDRAHFFGAAGRAMQVVLIDHARRHRRAKRGGEAARVTLREVDVGSAEEVDLLEVQDAIEALDRESTELGDLVRLRYFAGLTLEEIAEARDVSLATVKRKWTFARAWLHERLGGIR